MKRAILIGAVTALVVVAGVVSCASGDTSIGAPCTASSTCEAGTVCEPLDPHKPTGAAACLPMPKVQAPVACGADSECIARGFPIDATCDALGALCGDTQAGACCACEPNKVVCDNGLQVDPGTCACSASRGTGVPSL